MDQVTVSQAIHWFDIPNFYKLVDNVLRKGGVLAVFGYTHSLTSDKVTNYEAVNQLIQEASTLTA